MTSRGAHWLYRSRAGHSWRPARAPRGSEATAQQPARAYGSKDAGDGAFAW